MVYLLRIKFEFSFKFCVFDCYQKAFKARGEMMKNDENNGCVYELMEIKLNDFNDLI